MGGRLEDRERDRDFVAANDMTSGADEIWMNGDSIVKDARPLDTLFKQRMFASGGRLMARGRRAVRPPKARPRTLHQLESQLMLLGWANRQFGFESNQKLFDALKEASEGYDSDGRSHVARYARRAGSRCSVPPGDLARYDDNVRRHLASINAGRREPITLRYFQQLAALYAELFLDRRAAAPEALATRDPQLCATEGPLPAQHLPDQGDHHRRT